MYESKLPGGQNEYIFRLSMREETRSNEIETKWWKNRKYNRPWACEPTVWFSNIHTCSSLVVVVPLGPLTHPSLSSTSLFAFSFMLLPTPIAALAFINSFTLSFCPPPPPKIFSCAGSRYRIPFQRGTNNDLVHRICVFPRMIPHYYWILVFFLFENHIIGDDNGGLRYRIHLNAFLPSLRKFFEWSVSQEYVWCWLC